MSPEEKALESFIGLSSGLRIGTEDSLFERIKNVYPHLVVIEVVKKETSLVEFADAGNATYSSTTHNGHHYWSLEDQEVKCENRFASYKYSWDGKEFVVLEAYWLIPTQLPYNKFYIVHKKKQDIYGLIKGAGEWTSKLHNQVAVFKGGYWTKSKNYFNSIKQCSWDDVTMDPQIKTRLTGELPDFYGKEEVYRKFKAPWKRGIIFHGPPGNGKTTAIKAFMNQGCSMGVEILVVKSFEPRPTQSREDSIESVFQYARARGRCILVLEDMDQLLKPISASSFLNQMDGIENTNGIFCVASVNELERLDPALSKRPSRFDQKCHFPLPSTENREVYMASMMEGAGIEFPPEMAKCAAAITKDFSYASLKELMLQVAKEEAQPELDREPEAKPKTETELGLPDYTPYAHNTVYRSIQRHAAILKAQMGSSTSFVRTVHSEKRIRHRMREALRMGEKQWSGSWQTVAYFFVVVFALVGIGTWFFWHGKLESWAW